MNTVDPFNNIVKDMCLYIINFYKTDTISRYLKMLEMFGNPNYNNLFDQLIIMDKLKPIQMFVIHVTNNKECKKSIQRGDINFFMQYNFEGDMMLTFINEIKYVWNIMDSDSQTYIKQCLQALLKLSTKFSKSI